ncbi:MAG: hypothetical protein U0167_02940 [bacterium]
MCRRFLLRPLPLVILSLALSAGSARAVDIHELAGAWARYAVATDSGRRPLVDTLFLSTPRIEATADGDALWFQMEAYWQGTRAFAIAMLVSDVAFLQGGGPPAVVHRYILYPEKGDPLEYVDAATGRAYLPRFGLFQGLLPSASSGSVQPLYELQEYLGRALVLERAAPVGARMLSSSGPRVLTLDDRILIASSRAFRDDGRGQQAALGDYTYVPFQQSDYDEMIAAGFNMFRVPIDQLGHVVDRPAFFLIAEGTAGLADLFYRSNYWGGVMYMDEPDVRLGARDGFQDIVDPMDAADALIRYTSDMLQGSTKYGSRYLPLMLAEDYWDLGPRVDLVERAIPTWSLASGAGWYQMEAGAQNLVQEFHFTPSELSGALRDRLGVDFPAEADPCLRFVMGSATGATHRFGGDWGVSIFGQMDDATSAQLFPMAYERGARYFWLWTSDHGAHVQYARQLEIVRSFRDWLRTEPGSRPRQTRPVVAVTLPWGYSYNEDRLPGAPPGPMWRGGGIMLDDLGSGGAEYRDVLAAFYRTYLERIAAGEEVDLAYERPGEVFPIGDYDAVYRVLPNGMVVRASTGSGILASSASNGLRVLPNPFARTTSIRFEVPREARARADVYDVAGRLVRTLLPQSRLSPGSYTLWWNGDDDAGAPAASGVFFARVVVGDEKHSEKIVLRR